MIPNHGRLQTKCSPISRQDALSSKPLRLRFSPTGILPVKQNRIFRFIYVEMHLHLYISRYVESFFSPTTARENGAPWWRHFYSHNSFACSIPGLELSGSDRIYCPLQYSRGVDNDTRDCSKFNLMVTLTALLLLAAVFVFGISVWNIAILSSAIKKSGGCAGMQHLEKGH